jgi:hypothetical protein
MRPIYETTADLQREDDVLKVLEKLWNLKLIKLPIRYHLDFVAVKEDRAKAFVEVKTRNYSMQQIDAMGGYLMSIGKWSSAKSLYDCSGLPFVLVAKTTDGIYYSVFKEFKPDDILVRGRTDRNDWQDIEPCVVIRADKFKKLKD